MDLDFRHQVSPGRSRQASPTERLSQASCQPPSNVSSTAGMGTIAGDFNGNGTLLRDDRSVEQQIAVSPVDILACS